MTILKQLKKEDLLTYYDRTIAIDSPQRKKLSVRIFSEAAKNRLASGDCYKDDDYIETMCELLGPNEDSSDFMVKAERIKNVQQFKEELPLYPLAKPHLNITPGGVPDPGSRAMM